MSTRLTNRLSICRCTMQKLHT